jgi:flagellar FliJ protein
MKGKKFRFSLASILRLRQHETERTKQDLARKMQDRLAQEMEVSEAKDQLTGGSAEIEDKQTVTVKFLRRREAQIEAARQVLHRANERLADMKFEEQQTRQDLIQKRSAEEALQTLHDQEKAHHLRGIENAEDKQLEEQALDIYRRQQLSNEK